MKEIITTIKIDDNGNVIGTSTETKVIEEEMLNYFYSEYSRIFDWESPKWVKNEKLNIDFLKDVEDRANALIRKRAFESFDGVGRLYLNEVYDMLGLSKTRTGAVVGWTYSDIKPIAWSDNNVEIIFNKPLSRLRNGAILLDFNVDGNIVNLF